MNCNFDSNNLINKYANMIYRISLRYLENIEDAEDIVQDVFMKYIDYRKSEKNFNDEAHEKS